jgi:hypothetical protein
MSGGVLPVPRLADATVLLIDLQEEDRSGALALDGIDAAVERAAEVLARAHATGARVGHVAHASS